MEKLQRNERITALLKILSDSPGKVFTLGTFTEMFGSAKSTLSEDIDILRGTVEKFGLGMVETVPGASGGVKYIPLPDRERTCTMLDSLCSELSRKERILPGGYLYMLDIIYNPEIVAEVARIFTGRFYQKQVDYVITVETKGIPLAFMTAKFLNVPLVIVRHYSEATDGSSVNINYVSGSSRKVQTMVLPIKSLKRNSRLLFIDDFMKGGGTAKGILELAREFDCEVCGIGVLIQTAQPVKKLVEDYLSVLTLHEVNEEEAQIILKPSEMVF